MPARFFEYVIRNASKPDVKDIQTNFFFDLARCASFEGFSKIQMSAWSRPGPFAMRSLTFHQEHLAISGNNRCCSNLRFLIHKLFLFIPELQTIVMECIAYPGRPQSKGSQALVILNPDLFVFQRVGFAKLTRNVPCQRIDLPPFFYVLDDDGQIGFLT